ncbi:hypothetical protein L7F22_021450 [Adiantum nelumboides]|nr:hypothetical protein [Adiantum nelumboides]
MRSKIKLQVGARALGKNIRVSIAKMQRIIDQIQNCSYEEALESLEFMPYKTCHPIAQLVHSAAANASTNLGLNRSDSFVSKAWVASSKRNFDLLSFALISIPKAGLLHDVKLLHL